MNRSTCFLVVGANGQLARAFIQELKQLSCSLHAKSRQELDITSLVDIEQTLNELSPDVVLNCAAYNQVDQAEREPELATAVNEHAVANLAKACAARGIFLVHFSTDYVFDGNAQEAYVSTDQTNPINAYGMSKLAGERAMEICGDDCLILRLSWVYGVGSQNFFSKLQSWRTQTSTLRVVTDQVSTPCSTTDIVQASLLAIEKKLCGLYHFSHAGYASRYEIARTFFECLGDDEVEVVAASSSDFQTLAARPAFSALDGSALYAAIGLPHVTWQQALTAHMRATGLLGPGDKSCESDPRR